MENIETLLAAVAQTQGFDDDERVVSTPPELGLRNSVSEAATQLVEGVSGDVRPSPVVETAVPAPASASPAVGMVIGGGGKRKRGRPPRALLAGNPPPPKRSKVEDEEEDVCFICFDGGSLVLCDRKGCPKAYHPACIKRDEAFFQSKAKWNCGWHICSVCRKASYYMCYTCSYSLCKACTKNEDYVCVRGNKGFCSTCIKPIMLIENKDQATNESIQVDFDDKLSWEYLFKMYWLLLKEKLSLTLSEITQAKNPWKGVATEAWKPHSSTVLHTAVDGQVSMSYRSTEHLELNKPCVDINLIQNDGLRTSSNGNHVGKLQSDKGENGPSYNKNTVQQNMDKVTNDMSTDRATGEPLIKKVIDDSSTAKGTDKPCVSQNINTRESDKPAISSIEWASKDLLEFVAYMKNGDTSAISQFDVQTLLLDYIKRNNLRDPRRKSQIICDLRLTNLFGKPRVGHIEMLKLLEFHFLIKEDSQKNSFIPAGFVSSMVNDVESDGKIFGLAPLANSRKRKTRKKSEDRAPQQDVNEYAAIDVHNINLIYLRRNLMENLIDDRENFNDKVIGSIVRIRISTNDQKPEVHRLVQVVGTSKVPEPYKIGTRTADVMLEVLNLDKKEAVSIDAISNNELTEEECRRLRQSVRCGLVKHFTVGELQKKAVALQSVRVNDVLEAEVSRLNHLRDRASEKGHKKELRECVERLQLLKSPEERKRKISEVPEIHADPKMSPNYESEEDNRSGGNGKKGEYVRPSYSQFPRNGRKTRYNKKDKEERSTEVNNRIIEKTDASGSSNLDKRMNRVNIALDKHMNRNIATSPYGGKDDHAMQRSGLEVDNRIIEKTDASGSSNLDKHMNRINIATSPYGGKNDHAMQRSGLETSTAASCVGNSPSADNMEIEKLWHYRDPNGKIQGPFSMMQLRKWSTTGLFPPDMRIWTNHEQYDSLLLTDALSGKFHAASNLSHALSSCSHENKPTEAVGVGEGTNETSRENKQTETAAVMKADESGSSGWPQCWDLLRDSSSSGDNVKARNLPPSSPETRHVALTDRCQEGDDLNRGSQIGEKNSIGPTQSAMTSGRGLQSQSNNEDRAAKPSEENLRSLNINLSSNDIKSGSVFAPVSESANSSKQAETTDVFDLPSPTQKTQNQLSISADVPAQNSGVLELLSPSPRSNNENQGAHATETKQSGFINFPVSNSGPGWNSNVQLPEVADEWCGYSPTPARSSIQEWDPSLVSASPSKPLDVKNEIIDTSIPDGHQIAHDSSSHPVSNWLAILNEPIEFVALGEDSVSDLLAEVDALESQGALPSPTAAIKFARELLEDSKDDCFSSIEEFSSAHEPRRSDALSSTSDMHLSSQSSAPCKPNGTSLVDASNFFRRSTVNSSASSEGETNAPVHSSDAGSETHPPAPINTNQEIIGETMAPVTGSDPTDPGWGTTLQGNINLVTVQGNVNLVLGGPAQGMTNLGWGTSPSPTWANPSTNRSPRNGSLPWDGQRKYGGERFSSPREWGYQGGESGYGRGRPPWGRQTYGGGGGYSRPLPKGQRVCKFYEGGHCKKGAFCDYLHP